jgi:hypothetical protein
VALVLVSGGFVGLDAIFFVVFVVELCFDKLVGNGDGRFGLAGILLFDQVVSEAPPPEEPSGIDLICFGQVRWGAKGQVVQTGYSCCLEISPSKEGKGWQAQRRGARADGGGGR